VRLRDKNTVFQAEALAILHTIIWFISTAFSSVEIFSDSLSAVTALGNTHPKSPIILDIQKRCRTLGSSRFIRLNWIRAHAGFLGNELADFLAGSSVGLVPVCTRVRYPSSVLKNFYRERMRDGWQARWTDSDKGRFTYNIFNTVDFKLKFKNRVLVYFATGHGSFPTYLCKIGRLQDDKCTCGAVGDPGHYLSSRCSFSREYIKMKTIESLGDYLRRIDCSPFYLARAKGIYNLLNSTYSFIFTKL
ncbi:hypothetical protein JTE90_025414, partial [Oedothorax gibbosus]